MQILVLYSTVYKNLNSSVFINEALIKSEFS